jgi:hypothetical protein
MGSAFESASAWPSSTTAIVTATAIATTAFIAFGKISLWPQREKVLPSPLKTLSPAAVASSDTFNDLVYQPDQFPGARDVDTPVSLHSHFLVECGERWERGSCYKLSFTSYELES